MSGELHISASPVVVRLVRSLDALAQRVPISEFAVIGGLAVMVRLEGAHRVTDDLDTVATQHGDDPIALEVVIGAEGMIDGTKVDCIGVGDVPAAKLTFAELPEAALDRAFVLSHRWALDTAENQELHADFLEASVRVTCRFANAGSLVAMKLQSAPRRQGRSSHKAGGDLFDIFRLTSHPALTKVIANSLRNAPHDLGDWCATSLADAFVHRAERTAAVIARTGVAGANPPTAQELQRGAELLLRWFKDCEP